MRHLTRSITILLAGLLAVTGAVLAPQANAQADVYTTPGEHVSGGREWRTWCEPYSQTARCTTQLKVAGIWTFNNLTYLPSPRSLWGKNPLATPGDHRVQGRTWRTECDTARTGRNGCRSYLWDGHKFVFNNLVQFGALRSDLGSLYTYRPPAAPKPPTPPAAPSGKYSISKGPNSTNRVILTYDDCPKSMKAFKETVRAAEDLGVSIAMFPTGNCLKAGRFDADYARAHGHYVFNHSITHPDLTKVSYKEAVRELGAPGVVTTYGRPPYGAHNASVRKAYAAVGMKVWTWNLDTFDYRGKSSSELVSRVVQNASAGDSVLMHMQWHGFNGATIKAMRDGLKAKGTGMCVNRGAVAAKPAALNC